MKRTTKVLMILAMILAFTSGVSASTFIQWDGRKDYNYSLEYIKQIKSTISTKNQTIAEKEDRIIELEKKLKEQGNSNKEQGNSNKE